MVQHTNPNIVERTARRTAVWTVINGLTAATGPIPEFRQAQARVKAGATVPHTLPTYVPGSDPVLSRDEVEHSFSPDPPRAKRNSSSVSSAGVTCGVGGWARRGWSTTYAPPDARGCPSAGQGAAP